MKILIAGGAGFVASHLCDRLLSEGHQVIAVDNGSTGRAENLAHLRDSPDFALLDHDICEPLTVDGPVDRVYNLASPASPFDYLALPIETMMVGSAGTKNLLDLAREKKAAFLMASTSETYGDPLVHPQVETYWGNVNPIGPRSVYDEAKRFSEALTMAYHRKFGLPTHIARIFNTFGPRMKLNDGRVVPAFLDQALRGEPLTVFGDGSQTRSFCYVSDLVEGLCLLMESNEREPVNLGESDRNDDSRIRPNHPPTHRRGFGNRIPAPAARRPQTTTPRYRQGQASSRMGTPCPLRRRPRANHRVLPRPSTRRPLRRRAIEVFGRTPPKIPFQAYDGLRYRP